LLKDCKIPSVLHYSSQKRKKFQQQVMRLLPRQAHRQLCHQWVVAAAAAAVAVT
jgi:hypothetical protein